MDFLDDCQKHFGTKNLYEILELEKNAKENEIKSAYRKKSLKVHPDRVSDDRKENAKQAFQILAKVHYVLTNDELRGVYDESGIVITNEDSDFASFSTFEEYQNYWRTLFPKLTVKKIDDFLAKYINSEEEKTDLKNLYIRFEGDLNMIYEHHFAYDEERVIQMLNQMINSKEIPEFDSFVNERKSSKQKRKRRIAKEMVEAEKEELKSGKKSKKQNKGFDNDDDEVNDISTLQLAVLNKNKGNFDNLISNLEAKYAKKGNKKARR